MPNRVSLRPAFSDNTSERRFSLVSKLSGAIEAGRAGKQFERHDIMCHALASEQMVANERSIF